MSKNKYKNNDSLNKKVEPAFAENELRDELKDAQPNVAPVRDEQYPEEEAIPEAIRREAVAPSRDSDRFQRVDAWDNVQSKVRPNTDLHATDHVSDGGLGEFKEQLITDGMPREAITEVTDPAVGPAYGDAPRRGFPWWWILLPLIILGIIYGLTREPVDANNPPASTTSQFDQIRTATADPLSQLLLG